MCKEISAAQCIAEIFCSNENDMTPEDLVNYAIMKDCWNHLSKDIRNNIFINLKEYLISRVGVNNVT